MTTGNLVDFRVALGERRRQAKREVQDLLNSDKIREAASRISYLDAIEDVQALMLETGLAERGPTGEIVEKRGPGRPRGSKTRRPENA